MLCASAPARLQQSTAVVHWSVEPLELEQCFSIPTRAADSNDKVERSLIEHERRANEGKLQYSPHQPGNSILIYPLLNMYSSKNSEPSGFLKGIQNDN